MFKHSSVRKWVVFPVLALLLGTAPAALAQTSRGTGDSDGTVAPGSDAYKGPGTSQGATPDTGTGAGQYVDDAAVTAKVKAAVMASSKLKGTGISVETEQGVVKLTGTVDTEAQKTEAARLAKQVEGVRSVENNLTVSKATR